MTAPELPEPQALCAGAFTADQMLAIRDAGIRYGMEQAAQMCVEIDEDDYSTPATCAAAIRAACAPK
jgi:hypothetical protein